MMQYLPLILVFLLLLWQVYELHNDNFLPVSLLRQMIRWTLLMLLLALLLNMSVKKLALASEQDPFEHLEVQLEAETLTIQELFHFIKCFKQQLDPALKEECETEQLPYTIPFGTWK